MSWLSLALGLLRLVNGIMSWAEKKGHINEGKRQQLRAELVAIAKTAKAVKEARDKDEEASDEEVLRDLMS